MKAFGITSMIADLRSFFGRHPVVELVIATRILGLFAVCLLFVLAGLGSAIASASGVHAARRVAARPSFCGRYGVVCFRVSVPLDWSGTVPGRIGLEVKEYKPKGSSRGVIFLLAGGPGQASAEVIQIGRYGYWSSLFPGYTLVTFDPRGTGYSNPISCRWATGGESAIASVEAGGARCAQSLGSKRAFFSTSDNAMDIDAVRRTLGVSRIAVYGASYGTDVALAYAQAFPSHVSRLVLDSVASEFSPLSVVGEVLREIPHTLRVYCAHACSATTGDYAGEVIALANALEAKPITGRVLQPGGIRRPVKVDANLFLGLVIQTDLDPGLAAELPAAVHAARTGDPLPLLRIASMTESRSVTSDLGAVYTATSCDDGSFPWSSSTPIGERPTILKAAVDGLPANAFGGFGSWALALGNTYLCLEWPVAPASAATLLTYPDVPVLAVSGALDMRSPTLEARALLKRFPHGHLLVVTNAGHSALSEAVSACAVTAVHTWLDGKTPPSVCHGQRLLAPIATFAAGSKVPGRRPSAGATLSIVAKTIHEAEAAWLIDYNETTSKTVAGLNGGKLTITNNGFALDGYSLTRGVALTGAVQPAYGHGPVQLLPHGVVRIAFRGATIGTVAINGASIDGSLDGDIVTGGRLFPTRLATAAKSWSSWQPRAGSVATMADAVAAHVGNEYRLDQAGDQLVRVTSGPPRSPSEKSLPLTAVAQRKHIDSDLEFRTTTDTWTYKLCGKAPQCAIPGPPSIERGRLVHREALELALDTFEYIPAVSSLLVYLPPPPGELFDRTVLYFNRSSLDAQLSKPLDKTLTLAAPPLPSQPDKTEAATIDRLTLPDMYFYRAQSFGPGTAELELDPDQ